MNCNNTTIYYAMKRLDREREALRRGEPMIARMDNEGQVEGFYIEASHVGGETPRRYTFDDFCERCCTAQWCSYHGRCLAEALPEDVYPAASPTAPPVKTHHEAARTILRTWMAEDATAPPAAQDGLEDLLSDMRQHIDWTAHIDAVRQALKPEPKASPGGAETPREGVVERCIQRVAELRDRTSPDDWPEVMLVTADELADILREELAASPTALPAAQDGLIEEPAAAVHDAWIAENHSNGITTRVSSLTGEEQMVPYAQLSEPVKEYDRKLVRTVLAALRAQR